MAINRPNSKRRREVGEWLHFLQNGKCFLCGMTIGKMNDWSSVHMDPKRPTIDHVKPRSRGGGNEATNLVLVHESCNVAKGSRPMTPKQIQDHKRISSVIEWASIVKLIARRATTSASPPPQS